MRLSSTQRKLLHAVMKNNGGGWDSLFSDWWGYDRPIDLRNFDACSDALLRRGLIADVEGSVILTAAGVEVLRAQLNELHDTHPSPGSVKP